MSGPTGFIKKFGAEQGANDPNTRQRIIMAVQEWTASMKHFIEKLWLVVWWQWRNLTPADDQLTHRPTDQPTSQPTDQPTDDLPTHRSRCHPYGVGSSYPSTHLILLSARAC